MECYIAMARSKERCSDLNGIVRKLFNAARDKVKLAFFVCLLAGLHKLWMNQMKIIEKKILNCSENPFSF